jgi:hypothetical protein
MPRIRVNRRRGRDAEAALESSGLTPVGDHILTGDGNASGTPSQRRRLDDESLLSGLEHGPASLRRDVHVTESHMVVGDAFLRAPRAVRAPFVPLFSSFPPRFPPPSDSPAPSTELVRNRLSFPLLSPPLLRMHLQPPPLLSRSFAQSPPALALVPVPPRTLVDGTETPTQCPDPNAPRVAMLSLDRSTLGRVQREYVFPPALLGSKVTSVKLSAAGHVVTVSLEPPQPSARAYVCIDLPMSVVLA